MRVTAGAVSLLLALGQMLRIQELSHTCDLVTEGFQVAHSICYRIKDVAASGFMEWMPMHGQATRESAEV
jgi:hypothetical protein